MVLASTVACIYRVPPTNLHRENNCPLFIIMNAFPKSHFVLCALSATARLTAYSNPFTILSAFSRDFGQLRRRPFHSISPHMSSTTSSESSPRKPLDKEGLLCQLEAAVTAQQAAFCCGGTIQIDAARGCIYKHITVDTEPLVSPPVVIRWDLPSGKAIRKMTLPAVQGTPAISELLNDCSPATFGHKGREVLDQSYRQAVKLESHQFCTSFSPHDFGIIDAIAQTLLPGVTQVSSDTRTEFQEHWGVVAELDKLNVSRSFFALKHL
jgi:hypothetical protein